MATRLPKERFVEDHDTLSQIKQVCAERESVAGEMAAIASRFAE